MNVGNVEKLFANFYDTKNCYTHKKLQTAITSWIYIKNGIESLDSIDKIKPYIDRSTELRKNQRKKSFSKIFFQVDEQFSFWKSHGKWEQTKKYQACNNRSKKELFGIRTNVS